MAKRHGTARSGAKKSGRAKATRASKTARKTAARGGAKKGAAKARTAARPAKKPSQRTARRKTAARAAASRTTRRPAARKRGAPKPQSGVAAAATKVRGAVAAAVQAVAGSLPWSADEKDPLVLLEADHRRFEDLLKQGEETTERAVKGRTALLDTLTEALNLHELMEETVLYPALEPHADAHDIVLEGFQEHHVADLIVKELHDLAKDNEQWGAKFKVLKENIEHHIKEEEREMFPTARQVLSREDLEALGTRMRAMKAEAQRVAGSPAR